MTCGFNDPWVTFHGNSNYHGNMVKSNIFINVLNNKTSFFLFTCLCATVDVQFTLEIFFPKQGTTCMGVTLH